LTKRSVLGIDGCRAGWCVATFENDQIKVGLYKSFEEIIHTHDLPAAILIDIPVGLGDKTVVRDVDIFARKALKPIRYQSIFTPPVREALQAASYQEAKAINQRITGKMISIQSWNIAHKIRETDSFLIQYPEYK
jgi:predicted RNase H-like nuclease